MGYIFFLFFNITLFRLVVDDEVKKRSEGTLDIPPPPPPPPSISPTSLSPSSTPPLESSITSQNQSLVVSYSGTSGRVSRYVDLSLNGGASPVLTSSLLISPSPSPVFSGSSTPTQGLGDRNRITSGKPRSNKIKG
jgi:hypothetical protein